MKIVAIIGVCLIVFMLFSAVALAQPAQDQYTGSEVNPPTSTGGATYDPGRANLPSTGIPFSLLIVGTGLVGLGAASNLLTRSR